jgi:hypothetical protein
MALMNIYIELNDDHEGDNAPAFAHDLMKYTFDELVIKDQIKNYEWEIVE